MRYILYFTVLLLTLSIFACQKTQEQKADTKLPPGVHKITAQEVVQANSYTYIHAAENGKEYWMAVAKRELEEGAEYYYLTALEMKNFESKDLDRTFETIYFVENLSDKPLAPHGMDKFSQSPEKRKSSQRDESISVEPAIGGVTISELAKNSASYSGKTIKVRGQVTKFNTMIMGKNWAHLQDGTSEGEVYDLTVTTNDVVKVGDVVTFEGKIALDKDFGAGYSYAIIMEEAQVSAPNPSL